MLAPQRVQRKDNLLQEQQVSTSHGAPPDSRVVARSLLTEPRKFSPALVPSSQARRAVIALLKHVEKERAGSAALFADADTFSLVRRAAKLPLFPEGSLAAPPDSHTGRPPRANSDHFVEAHVRGQEDEAEENVRAALGKDFGVGPERLWGPPCTC